MQVATVLSRLPRQRRLVYLYTYVREIREYLFLRLRFRELAAIHGFYPSVGF
jgi:hypothetical protein